MAILGAQGAEFVDLFSVLFYLQCYIYLVTLFCISGEFLCNIFSRLW